MNMILKATIGALICVVFGVVLARSNKESAILLSIAGCCMLLVTMLYYLTPIMDFVQRLKILGNLDSDVLGVLLKAVGIALIGEVVSLICTDAGNGALGKLLQMLVAAVILWLSIPLLHKLIDLIENILGSL